MSEDLQAPAAPAPSGGVGADVVVALSGASRDKADAFLEDQRAMLHLQMEEMRQRNPYEISHFRLRRFSDFAKAAFEFSIGLIALALVGGLGVMVWKAAGSEGLIVESFAVPAELAQKGLSGQVIAGQLTDRLAAMQAATASGRAARSYSNNWGDDIKVEIPETGVSVSEAYRFLKSWLGHETHVGGEVWKTESGLAIAARAGGGSSSFSGGNGELDLLIQKTAEDIYSRTQPYRYASYLAGHGRQDEALVIYKSLALNGPAGERGWGYAGWVNLLVNTTPIEQRIRLLEAAEPYGVAAVTGNLGTYETNLGHAERGLALRRKAREILGRESDISPAQMTTLDRGYEGQIAYFTGDYRAAVAAAAAGNFAGSIGSVSMPVAIYQAADHDLAASRATLADLLPSSGLDPAGDQIARLAMEVTMAMAMEDWEAADKADRANIALTQKFPVRVAARRTVATGDPRTALIAAHLGRFAQAEALLRPMPGDCYQCLRARAQVAALRGQPARADWWFERAVAAAPSLPFAEFEWGQALLERRQYDAAIAKFAAAARKSPHFPDPQEYWGEALMAKSQSHLALAKFNAAEKYAPNWGRLHLKWGEALAYAGKSKDAKAQFARAAGLDLTLPEKAELARQP